MLHISFKAACSSLVFSTLGTPSDGVISPTIAIKVRLYLKTNLKIKRVKCHLRFGQFCDFRPKLCFSTSGSKKFEILLFSSSSLTPSIFSLR
ncbi:hypothetical protein Hanom_Chr00s003369g01712231 [Helianthus anomalus]